MKTQALHLIGAFAAIGAIAFVSAPGCGGQTSALCDAICDCEHCNDYTKKISCDNLSGEEAVAKDYGCDSQFSDYLTCQQNSGQCNTEKASYSTKTPGHCDGPTTNYMSPCKTNADCTADFGAMAFCSTTCQTKTCDSTNMQQCSEDSDCPDGTDQCATAQKAYLDCQQSASAVKGADGQATPGN